jgi:hypothetical protein
MYWVHLDRLDWAYDGYTLVEPKRITVVVQFHLSELSRTTRLQWSLTQDECIETCNLQHVQQLCGFHFMNMSLQQHVKCGVISRHIPTRFYAIF